MRSAMFCVAAAAALAASGLAHAAPTTADQLIDAACKADGATAWADKGTVELEYAYSGQGLTGVVRSRFDPRTGAFADSQDTGAVKGGDGFDGHTAWMQDPSGAVTPQAGGDKPQVAINEAYRNAALWCRADRGGAKIELLAPQTADVASYDVVRVTPAGGKPFDAWLDAKTHLLARAIETQGSLTITSLFSDYRSESGLEVAGKQVVDLGFGPQYRSTATLSSVKFGPRSPASAYGPPHVTLTDGKIDNPEGRTTVPFQLLNNHIYLQVKVNGKGPFLFIFDTGGHDLLTPEGAKELAVHSEGDAPGSGAGEGVVEAGFARGVTFQIGELTLANQNIGVLPFASKAVEGFEERGMLGFEVLRRFVTEIDYGAGTITFIDPAKFHPKDQGVAVPFVFSDHLPQVNGAFEGAPGRFNIDTGSRVELTLTKPFVDDAGLIAKHPKGVTAVDGWGVGGPSRSYVTRGTEFTLGPVKIDDLVVGFSTQSKGAFADPTYQGNVGTALLKRFKVTFDYDHEVMYLKRLAKPADVDVFDRAGIWINQSPDGFKIVDLTAGSAAADAGLKVGDEITSVDGATAQGIALTDMRQRLRDEPAGTAVKLTVRSGDATKDVVLTLKDQI
jgi:PDZ domain-containing protein/aspartyl protease